MQLCVTDSSVVCLSRSAHAFEYNMKLLHFAVLLLLVEFYAFNVEASSLSIPPRIVQCNFYKSKLKQIRSENLSAGELTKQERDLKMKIKMFCEEL